MKSERFQVMNVPDFMGMPVTDLLLHNGSFPQVDSKGCELLGRFSNGAMILDSKDFMAKFMGLQAGVNQFKLTVKSGVVTC